MRCIDMIVHYYFLLVYSTSHIHTANLAHILVQGFDPSITKDTEFKVLCYHIFLDDLVHNANLLRTADCSYDTYLYDLVIAAG